ncbi:hypothetical protein C0993_004939 [Termitomyces sp. T159_Od127]|nr:hypothetical protein C0993_004939 [Termitomyces sp. T159_Od127]
MDSSPVHRSQRPSPFQPLDAITAKAKATGTIISSSLSDTDLNAAADVASGKEAAIVFITGSSSAGSCFNIFSYSNV